MVNPKDSASDHLVTGLSEIVVTCGGCGLPWTQPIDPARRFSYHVCPDCNHAAPTRAAFELLDGYELRR